MQVKDEKKIQEVFDLADYERSEELRKSKSRSKKNHSKFTLLRCRQPGNTVPNLVFLAVSPEEKESWINALNGAIIRAKNRILDEVTVEEKSLLAHPTRDRAKIPHTRRLPTRGHLMAVASTSTSDGMLTLDLIQEEDVSASQQPNPCEKSLQSDLEKSVSQPDSNTNSCKSSTAAEVKTKSGSLPNKKEIPWDYQNATGQACTPQPGKKLAAAEKSRCASMDEILSHSDTRPAKRASPALTATALPQSVSQLQDLITLKLQRTQELLVEVKGSERKSKDSTPHKNTGLENNRAEAERLLQEAVSAWSQAREVLDEVKEIQALYWQMDSSSATTPTKSQSAKLKSPQQIHHKKTMLSK
ncbi:pleckstrin-like domain-containing family O member 1-like [Scleropages formosus]|uniref:Pleckstrin-like domain-containing family O member 1-like n=1 Tax=Scleropages formosus TaxID=113540 RepID=A0A0P7XQA0_SCLFO|nr:pleckstrin-like domain-containing family O member 1-like [Scleropages formosus]